MATSGTSDHVSVDKILGSENLKSLMKHLVKQEIKLNNSKTNHKQKISDVLTRVSRGHSDLLKLDSTPILAINDLCGEYGKGVSEAEKQIRCSHASLYRLMDLFGYTLNIYNHITVRGSGDSSEFFVNPIGLLYREVTASSLIKINTEGETLSHSSTIFGMNMTSWILHAAVHSIRHDIRVIIHTHIPDVIAVGCMRYGLLPLGEEAVSLLDESLASISRGVRYHDYYGIAVLKSEWSSIERDLGPHSKVLFLRNHGVLACGNTVVEAWILVKQIAKACEHQVRLFQELGEEALLSMEYKASSSPNVLTDSAEMAALRAQRLLSAELEFEADMRLLDKAGGHTGYQYRHEDLLKTVCTENGGVTTAA